MEIQLPYVIPQSSQKPNQLTLKPDEPASRYKTRQLQIQVVGKSKMIKTNLLNILDVAKDMQVPPAYIGTFMGYVIGAQAKFYPNKPDREKAFLSGEHDSKDLSKIMTTFISEVLLCPSCSLPEINLKVEDGKVMGTCRACGGHNQMRINDPKFVKYVVNHPPVQEKGASFAGNKAGAKKDTSKAEDKEKKEAEVKSDAKDKSEKKEKKDKKEKKEKEDEVIWHSDTSEEAVRRRREAMLPDAEKKESADELAASIRTALSLNESDGVSKVKSEKGANDKDFATALFAALFADGDLVAQCKEKSAVLAKNLKSRDAQVAFLAAMEEFYGKNVSQISKVPVFLKELYDKDILDEDSIIEWNNTKASFKDVRTQAVPMIKWFQEAEEESDEE